ncbi:hypothetical protein BDR05DRAFT_1006230 [Suillus weaverae]|nr:hypothetical protein BDR05DRAFT_1006230 [Suillus weaverae]
MTITQAQVIHILQTLTELNVSVSAFVMSLLESPHKFCQFPINDLAAHFTMVLATSLAHPNLNSSVVSWASTLYTEQLKQSVVQLSKEEHGWHFSTTNVLAEQLEEFWLEDMAKDIEHVTPDMWHLLDALLLANQRFAGPTMEHDIANKDEEQYWAEVEDVEERSGEVPLDVPTSCHMALVKIKKVVIVSILMQSMNQKCNAFESVMGIFLHSCNTPEKVIRALASMGISISVRAINMAIHSLSLAYTYDNFDIDFKTSTPIIEKAIDTLTHMTSGDLIYLEHGVTTEDLQCSTYLWNLSHLNHTIPTHLLVPTCGCGDLLQLHPEQSHLSNLSRRQRRNAFKFMTDLVKHGPPYFSHFSNSLHPETVDQIPVTKMRHAPARAMDINQFKVSGNIEAITDLLHQGGIGEPSEVLHGQEDTMVDIGDYVIIFHGDLGTAERVQMLKEQCSIEVTPWRCCQYVVFVMGLFHLKMACADAIWCIFIEPKAARDDATSLMHFVALNRPQETGKIGSDPGFQWMHEVIGHTGITLRLDAWQQEVQRRFPTCKTLEAFAKTNPSQELIEEIAFSLAKDYVASSEDVFEARCQPANTHDKQQENVMLMHQYFLLYEELSWSMNEGDIRCVEILFLPWIFLFHATGKHKYAKHMTKFLTNIHFLYPERLRHVIHYNILVNPTRKKGKFCGVDWVVESLNLHTKESPL